MAMSESGHIAAPDVYDGTSVVGESRTAFQGASVGQPTEPCLGAIPQKEFECSGPPRLSVTFRNSARNARTPTLASATAYQSSAERGLLSGVRHKPAVNHVPAELPLAAVVESLLGPMALRIALADAVALILRNGRQD